jgi:hypothetical protein
MSGASERRGGASWRKTFVVLAFVGALTGGLWWYAPDRGADARACSARCIPKRGLLVPDPVFEKSFKPQAYFGPLVCRCGDAEASH